MLRTKQFPPQKERASRSTEDRRDRGANNKRLPCTEAALVAFSAPIANRIPEAHETPDSTRDGEGVPKVAVRGQLPGCLPDGATLDSLITREQFCIWRGVGLNWFSAHKKRLPGVVGETRKTVRVHPRTYLEKSVKGAK